MSTATSPRASRRPSRTVLVQVLLGLLGSVAVAVTLVLAPSPAGRGGEAARHQFAFLLLGAAMIVALVRWPVPLPRRTGAIVVVLDAPILLSMAADFDAHVVLPVYLAAATVGQLVYPSRERSARWKVANVGLVALCSSVATLVLTTIATTGMPAAEFLGFAAAALAFYVVDVTATVMVLSAITRLPGWPDVVQSITSPAGLVYGATCSISYVALVVGRTQQLWTVLLLVPPLAALLVVGRAVASTGANRHRSSVLVRAAGVLADLDRTELVGPALVQTARDLMDHGAPELRHRPPGRGEIGAAVQLEGNPTWLVVATGHREALAADDEAALGALASLAQQTVERLDLHAALRRSARIDGLTGLANRGALMSALRAEVSAHPDSAGRGLVLIDLDDFKSMNDSLGHLAGDDYLIDVAGVLEAVVAARPGGGLSARLGGDEFAALFHDPAPGALQDAAEEVRAALDRDIELAGAVLHVRASVGCAGWHDGEDVASVFTQADIALYRSKRVSKGQLSAEVYEALADVGTRRELLAALRADVYAMQVHYQPVVDLRSGAVDGLEALLRWNRDGEWLSPDVFVPLAEQAGLIVDIGAHVLRTVCRDIPELQQAAGRPLKVAVNLSARQLLDPQLPHLVGECLSAAGEGTVVLELTERVLAAEASVVAALHRLAALGALIALDDFGVGYSAIGYLRTLPVGVIKIDSTLAGGVARSEHQRKLVAGLVALCEALEVALVVEGVEDPDELAVLVDLGVGLAQGWVFSPALARDDALDLLRDGTGFAATPARRHEDATG